MRGRAFNLFERFGLELEYMMVDAVTLAVRPEADRFFRVEAGNLEGELVRGGFAWSNELALHVVELKTRRPAVGWAGLVEGLDGEVRRVNARLAEWGACLLPSAMHPWMEPKRESRLWPHGGGEVYAAFDRVFGCAGHGWTNLQSAHWNLPFRTASEFRRLHTAVRVVLPLMPALAASSPFQEGRRGTWLDMRLASYRENCRRVPSVTGRVVPELVRSPSEYRSRVLGRIYRDLAPYDPEGMLRHEWVNARGAIARFDRNTIEIRVLDVQECPLADVAIGQFLVAVLRGMVSGERSSEEAQARLTTPVLERMLVGCAREGLGARVEDGGLRRAWGVGSRGVLSVREFLAVPPPPAAPARARVPGRGVGGGGGRSIGVAEGDRADP